METQVKSYDRHNEEKAYRLPDGERENIINFLLKNDHQYDIIKEAGLELLKDRTDFELAKLMIYLEKPSKCNLSNFDISHFEIEEERQAFLANASNFCYDINKVRP